MLFQGGDRVICIPVLVPQVHLSPCLVFAPYCLVRSTQVSTPAFAHLSTPGVSACPALPCAWTPGSSQQSNQRKQVKIHPICPSSLRVPTSEGIFGPILRCLSSIHLTLCPLSGPHPGSTLTGLRPKPVISLFTLQCQSQSFPSVPSQSVAESGTIMTVRTPEPERRRLNPCCGTCWPCVVVISNF